MKEPKPLLREGASDFERQLLSAVRRERPSPQQRSRMRQTLGLTGPIAWAGGVKAMLSSLVGKGALTVAVVGLVAAGAVGLGATDAEPTPARVAPAPVKSAPLAPRAELEAVSVPTLPAPTLAPPAPDTSAAEPAASNDLREEILLLDGARAALQRGAREDALQQLDSYRQRFPSGILSREAGLLRQQATRARRAR